MIHIQKAFINRLLDNGNLAEVKTLQGQILQNVQILYPYGYYSKIEPNSTSEILLFYSMGSKTNIFGVPYNFPIQPQDLQDSEVRINNPKTSDKITFKKDGNIEIETENDLSATINNLIATASSDITVNGANISATASSNATLDANQISLNGAVQLSADAPIVDLGDAINFVLNQAATLQVTIPTGSSQGTYPVTIVSPGQAKVKA